MWLCVCVFWGTTLNIWKEPILSSVITQTKGSPYTQICIYNLSTMLLNLIVWQGLSSPLPMVSSDLSLSSSGTLLSDPFLFEERELRCSLCSRPLLPGKLCDWLASCRFCCAWLCCWEVSVPWEPFRLVPDEVITGRGLLAWARV